MIEKFNNIYYLLIYILHFAGIGIYAYQTVFQTRKFCTKFEIDDSGFPMVRFVGSFMIGWVLMALYIMFIRRNGVIASGSFFNLVFLTNLIIFLVNSYSILIDKTGIKSPEKSREGLIAPLIFSALSASLCYGLADKIYLY
tara:strand:+ start:1090 stop:1512 length:423 start_codon:yes stop_codon:yes gene_type:complete